MMNNLEKKVDTLVQLILVIDKPEYSDVQEKLKKDLQALLDSKDVPTPVSHKVANILLELGTPDSLSGHAYLMSAVQKVVEDPSLAKGITKVLYPRLAEEFNTTDSQIERCIRHAIEVTWDRADPSTIDKYFGSTVSRRTGKPTNIEFIARITNAVRMTL